MVDSIEPTDHGTAGTLLTSPDHLSGTDLDSAVLRIIRDDPFATVGEIRRQARRLLQDPSIGWWRVFGVLRRHRLLRKRSRFRLFRRSR